MAPARGRGRGAGRGAGRGTRGGLTPRSSQGSNDVVGGMVRYQGGAKRQAAAPINEACLEDSDDAS